MTKTKLMTGVLACAMAVSMAVPAFAADISVAGGDSAVPVPLTAEAATFSVTVPTSLPITVSNTGVVTTSPEVKIINNSVGAVKVTNMTIAGANAWETVDFDAANMASEKVGAKKIAMTINNQKTTGANTLDTFSAANFPKMDGTNATASDELAITYAAKVPAQATALKDAAVANVTFTIGWDA